MPLRVPSSSLIQVGGKQEGFFWRPGFQSGRNSGNQADDTGMDLRKLSSPCQELLCKRSIL